MDDPDFEMITANYSEQTKISILLSGTSSNRSFFDLNISSLTFHFIKQGKQVQVNWKQKLI